MGGGCCGRGGETEVSKQVSRGTQGKVSLKQRRARWRGISLLGANPAAKRWAHDRFVSDAISIGYRDGDGEDDGLTEDGARERNEGRSIPPRRPPTPRRSSHPAKHGEQPTSTTPFPERLSPPRELARMREYDLPTPCSFTTADTHHHVARATTMPDQCTVTAMANAVRGSWSSDRVLFGVIL